MRTSFLLTYPNFLCFLCVGHPGAKRSPECLPDRCVVEYGMLVQFRLANQNVSSEPIYLASDNASPTKSTRMAGHQPVFLTTDKDNALTLWRIQHYDPARRLESEGCPVHVSHLSPNTGAIFNSQTTTRWTILVSVINVQEIL